MLPLERQEFLQKLLEVPILDLGPSDQRFAGIFTPSPEFGAKKIGITEQFLGNAETYSSTYSDTVHFTKLFRLAFQEAGYVAGANKTILDMGSGSGTNTIMPCLSLFPACRIVATDISPNLLSILERYIVSASLERRVFCIATNAMNNFFRPSCFDIVTGASILHHLIDPERALRAAFRVLKPGGTAFFFEPFEGCALVRIAFTLILEAAPRMAQPIDEAVRNLLTAMIEDYRVRTGSDKTGDIYQHLDDKWLFTRRYLEQAAARVGFASISIVPQASHAEQYQDFVQSLLRVTGLSEIGLPDWAWEMIKVFDTSLSAEMKWDVPLEGIIILKKA